MRRSILAVVLVALIVTSVPAFAELQNVIVGGSIRIRGNWATGAAGASAGNIANQNFGGTFAGQGPWAYSYRGAAGDFHPFANALASLRYSAQPGRGGAVTSLFGWDDANHTNANVEQRTRLSVRADFTDAVSAFIEFDSYDIWGQDFRARNYVTGVDIPANSSEDVEVFQAYIEANEMFGYPVRVRVGRQELMFGSGWLVGPADTASSFTGTSFDAIRATYATDQFSVDAFWAKLADFSAVEEDSDIDLYGVYGSYLGIENITLDAYYFLLRDAQRIAVTNSGWFSDWVEDIAGVDNYDPTTLHTIGLRGAGTYGAFDFEAEAAYEFGNADQVGARFAGFGVNPYGAEGTDWDQWAANLSVGYTFDMTYTPRVFISGAYFSGEDNRDISFGDWLGALFCPFWTAEPSVSFNRMFSSYEYSQFIDNTDLSNFWTAKVGVSAMPTESLKVTLTGSYLATVEAYDSTWPLYWVFGQRIQWFNNASFISQENEKELGWEVELNAVYNYTEDLSFEVGYAHLFTGDGLAEGNFINGNGLAFNGGTSDDDADYVYFETKIAF